MINEVRIKEIEANNFALMLLVPSKFLAEDLNKLDYEVEEDDIIQLAKKYKISPLMMSVRIGLFKK